jgi:glutamyl aminopeptidase
MHKNYESNIVCRYLNEENPQEKKKLMYGLSQTKEPWILKRFLELAKNESNVRSQVKQIIFVENFDIVDS